MNREGKKREYRLEKSPADRTIMVLSGKGGVGKSTVAANLALSLSLQGHKVGLLDSDFHGPSIPKLLGLEGTTLSVEGDRVLPATLGELKVVSIDFMLPQRTDAVIWRGPMKMNVIRQLLEDVAWGELDYLIVDSPPGTGDEPLSVAQLIPEPTGALLVTTPQDLSTSDVRRSITFCRKLSLPVLGVVENMSGFVCPNCGHRTDLFGTGGGERMASEMGVPFLGRVPVDPAIVHSGDHGRPFAYFDENTPYTEAFQDVLERLVRSMEEGSLEEPAPPSSEPRKGVRIALPLAGGKLSRHFGRAEEFVMYDTDPEKREILESERSAPPPHEEGSFPRLLSEKGVDVLLTGGLGRKARAMLEEAGVVVISGLPEDPPEELARRYMEGNLQAGDNACDH
ncbi:P-loop NTPase [Candidatus Fermentibacteria bacterium]|nr:P-loop NTPase [Candidatus Fermentibacteria bacterium]